MPSPRTAQRARAATRGSAPRRRGSSGWRGPRATGPPLDSGGAEVDQKGAQLAAAAESEQVVAIEVRMPARASRFLCFHRRLKARAERVSEAPARPRRAPTCTNSYMLVPSACACAVHARYTCMLVLVLVYLFVIM